MNCREIEKRLFQNSDDLPAAVTEHLAHCAACHRYQQGLLQMRSGARALFEEAPIGHPLSHALAQWHDENVQGQLLPQKQPALAKLPRRAAVAGAGLVLLLSLGIAILHKANRALLSSYQQAASSQDVRPKAPAVVGGTPGTADRTLQPLPPRFSPRKRERIVDVMARGNTAIPQAILASSVSDLAYLNTDPAVSQPGWSQLGPSAVEAVLARIDRTMRQGDDFVRVPFPRVAGADAASLKAAATAYRQAKEVVDARLAHNVSLSVKGLAFSDLCKKLQDLTGVEIRAGRSVADDKATIFCKEQPLRDLMRQINRVFGFTWAREGEPGAYRYELVQDLRSQLLEEELRNRDRAEALLDIDHQMEGYRKNLGLSPEEAAEKQETASELEKNLLWAHSQSGSGPIQLFLGLSPDELNSLRNGQSLKFSADPGPGERPMPAGVGDGLMHFPESFRIHVTDQSTQFGPAKQGAAGQSLSAFPGAKPIAHLSLQESEPGKFDLIGGAGVKLPGRTEKGLIDVAESNLRIATGLSPSVRNPRNEVANAALKARFERDPALRLAYALQPAATCELFAAPYEQGAPGPRVTSADVLETLYRATGQSIVADYYTRVYVPADVSVASAPLFNVLCKSADAMRLRWKWENNWLQFRSTNFFNERRMEVPNRLLERWAASRRRHGALGVDDLAEIAQLNDIQMRSNGMSNGARAVYGLKEWHLVRNQLRSQWQFLAGLSAAQRAAALTEAGLPYAQMNPAQQRQFCETRWGGGIIPAENVAEAAFRLRYTPPDLEPGEKVAEPLPGPGGPPIQKDRDADLLRASLERLARWNEGNMANAQFIYRYLGGKGSCLHDVHNFLQEYEGKVFD